MSKELNLLNMDKLTFDQLGLLAIALCFAFTVGKYWGAISA